MGQSTIINIYIVQWKNIERDSGVLQSNQINSTKTSVQELNTLWYKKRATII